MNVRTSIAMDEELLKGVRELAARMGWNLSQAISELVIAGMHAHATFPSREQDFKWKTFRGRVRVGVDIDDRDRLYDLMEGPK